MILFPHLSGLQVESLQAAGPVVRIAASTRNEPAACPGCDTPSIRAHSRYRRRLADTPIASRELLIHSRGQRLFCVNHDCGSTTFAEQVPGLTARHARRTPVLQQTLCADAPERD